MFLATDIERLVVQLSADVRGYQNALNKAMGVTNRQTRAIESRFQKMNKNISASFANSLRGGVAGIGGALGVREIQQYADAWTEAGNKIRASATASGVQARSLDSLKDGANEARVALGDYTDLYARLIRSASGVAKSEQEIADVTLAVSKAFKAGGASAQEQAAGILQLGQALGSGVLQGDELRSLRENAPVVAKAIADEFGVTIAGLKKLGAEGKLTSDRVFRAIIKAIPGIEKQFAQTNATIGDGFTALKNNLTQYIGTMAESVGLTTAVNNVLQALAGNIGSVANAAAAAGAALLATFGRGALLASVAAFANPFVLLAAAVGGAAYAVTQLWDDIVPLQGSFATLGDYAQALWALLSDGATQAKETIVWAFEGIVQGISGALEGVGTSFEQVWGIVKSGANTIIDTLVKMAETVGVAFTGLPSAIADGVISTMNTMVQLVQDGINKVIGAVNTAIEAMNSLGAGIPTVPPVDLGKIRNDYAGAGKAAADAFGDIWSRETRDYVGDAGSAISGAVGAATDAIVAKANQVAEVRRELERETNRAGGYAKPNTAGYGGGGPTVDDDKKKKKGGIKKTADDRFNEDIDDIKKRTAALLEEQATLRMSFYEQQRRKTSLELEQKALESVREAARQKGVVDWQNIQLSAEQKRKIEEVSVAYAKQADELRKAQEQMELERDILKGLFGDIRSALEDGKITAAEWGDIFLSVLDKIIDKIEDDLIDAILNAGQAGSGLGGILGGIFRMFTGGFGGGTNWGALSASGKYLFDKGGYTGQGGKYQPAGIVHKGEYVVPKNIVDKVGAGNIESMFRGYANGGLVSPSTPIGLPRMPSLSGRSSSRDVVELRLSDDSGRMADIANKQIQTASGTIVRLSVQQSQKATQQALPSMLADAQMRKF